MTTAISVPARKGRRERQGLPSHDAVRRRRQPRRSADARISRPILIALCLGSCALLSACQPDDAVTTFEEPRVVAASDIEAGRYIVMTSGCNDCHTPMYARTNGAQPPEREWLKGSPDPHTGPWGTSYGKNLRLTVARLTEDEWVELLNTGTSLPPMPWPSVRNRSDYDKRALYRYIKSLPGDPGEQAPDPLPPGLVPSANSAE